MRAGSRAGVTRGTKQIASQLYIWGKLKRKLTALQRFCCFWTHAPFHVSQSTGWHVEFSFIAFIGLLYFKDLADLLPTFSILFRIWKRKGRRSPRMMLRSTSLAYTRHAAIAWMSCWASLPRWIWSRVKSGCRLKLRSKMCYLNWAFNNVVRLLTNFAKSKPACYLCPQKFTKQNSE